MFSFTSDYTTKEKAVFGEVSYLLTDQLEATFGARYSDYDLTTEQTASGFVTLFIPVQEIPPAGDSKTTFKGVLSYRPNDNAMIYARAAQGYRIGNSNPTVPDPTSPLTYGPDNLWSYELGAKTAWLDGDLILNGAVYYIDWEDMQLTLTSELGFPYQDNAGNTRSIGAEVEADARLGEYFSYSVGAAFTDATIRVDNASLGAMAGDRVPGVAKVTFSQAGTFTYPFTSKLEGYARVDHQFVGGSSSSFNQAAAVPMGDYHLVNMRAGARFEGWDASIFVTNIFDEDAIMTALSAAAQYQLRPRTIGLNVRASF